MKSPLLSHPAIGLRLKQVDVLLTQQTLTTAATPSTYIRTVNKYQRYKAKVKYMTLGQVQGQILHFRAKHRPTPSISPSTN